MVASLWGPIAPTADATPTPTASASADGELAVPGLTDPPWLAWRTQTLDEEGASLTTETAVDDEGRVWVAHDDEPNVQLGLKYRDASGWHEAEGGPDEGNPEAMVTGPEDRTWVLWVEHSTAMALSIYDADTDTWDRIDPPRAGLPAGMAFGPNEDILHIVWLRYRADQPDVAEHAMYDHQADDWTFEQITTGGLAWLDMAVGPDGRIHAAWTKNDHASTYAVRDLDGTWHVDKTEECRDHALATDDEGVLHWACNNDQGIVYKQRTPGGEVSREIAQDGSELVPPRGGGNIGYDLEVIVDDHGRPHLVYATTVNPSFPDNPTQPGVPVYAVKLADGWHSQAIDREGTWAGDTTSLALDDEGRPHLSYVQRTRAWTFSCEATHNPCQVLRFAEPAVATAAWAADSATTAVGIGQ